MFGVELKIAASARKAALVSASMALAIVGTAFLTSVAWMVLMSVKSAVFAAAAIGLIYVGAALVVLAFALSSRKEAHTPRPEAGTAGLSPMQLVAVSFLQGIEQGARARKPKT